VSGHVLAVVREAGARAPASSRSAARLGHQIGRSAGVGVDLAWSRGDSPLDGRWQACWRFAADPEPSSAAQVLAKHVGSVGYSAVVVEDTPFGRELAGRIAQRLGAAVAGGVLAASWSSEGVEVTRSVEGGRRTARLLLRPPAILLPSVEAAANVALPPAQSPHSSFLTALGASAPFQLSGEERLSPWEIDVAEADVVVAGGRGVGGPEGFAALAELAGLLNGAIGASRVAVDLGWAPRGCQIGATGKTVAPRLYLACGISGASHHVLGMRSSGFIVAINPDPHAPIHQVASVSIVSRLEDVLPGLIDRLRPRSDRTSSPAAAMAGSRSS
jgi:electron transfer flavoprotein alpha subunit